MDYIAPKEKFMDYINITPSYTDFYGEYITPLTNAVEYVLAQTKTISEQCQNEIGRSPVENVKYRIKSPESMAEKLRSHKLSVNAENAVHGVYDAAGVRIVTSFLEDIELMAEKLRCVHGLKVISEKNYIQKPKENGYRSYHMICEVLIPEHIYIEIQLRTIAMDTWAAADHRMQYKKLLSDSSIIAQELKRCAEELARVDMSLQNLSSIYLIEQKERSNTE